MISIKQFITLIQDDKNFIASIQSFCETLKSNDTLRLACTICIEEQNLIDFLNTELDFAEQIKEIKTKYDDLLENTTSKDVDLQAISLFNKMLGLHEVAKKIERFTSILSGSDVVEQAKKIVVNYEAIINIYKEFTDFNNPSQKTTSKNIDVPNQTPKTTINDLEEIIKDAIEPANHFKNYKVALAQLLLIKHEVGENLFQQILKKYKLSENDFTLDDLRMLIIGILVNCNEPWEKNKFILSLLKACEIQGDPKDDSVMEKLRSKMKLDDEVWKRISEETHKISDFWGDKLKYFKSNFLSDWDFLLPIRFKANNAFIRDYKSSLAIANIDAYKNNIQPFASNQYIHDLAAADFSDGNVIPVLETNGEKNFYKVKHIIDEKSIHGFALIPVDPDKSLDIKVMFKNSKNLTEAILDTEHYLPYQEFKTHKKFVLQQLNKIMEEFKQNPKMSDTKKNLISLTIGGQGTGGTLASHLMHEIISSKARNFIKDFVQKDPVQNSNIVSSMLTNNITEQLKHEADSFEHYKSDLDKQKALDKYSKSIEKYANKHLLNEDLQLDGNESLLSINNLHLSTVNSGGIPVKIKNNFIQSLRLLKSDYGNLTPPNLNISYSKIVNTHDIVKKTGAADIGVHVPSHLLSMKILQITSPDPEYKEHLKEIGFSSAIIAGKGAIDCGLVSTIPYISPVITFSMNYFFKPTSYSALSKKVVENMRTMWRKAKDIHYNNHLHHNSSTNYYKVLDNNNPGDHGLILEELNNKISKGKHSALYKKIKKKTYKIFRKIQRSLEKKPTEDVKIQPASIENKDVQPATKILTGFNNTLSQNKQASLGKLPKDQKDDITEEYSSFKPTNENSNSKT